MASVFIDYNLLSNDPMIGSISTPVDYTGIYARRIVAEKKEAWEPYIEKVIFNPPATIVFWKSGGKTVVKCNEPDKYDKAKGVALCYMKKALGNKSGPFNNMLRKAGVYYTEEEKKQEGEETASLIDMAADTLKKGSKEIAQFLMAADTLRKDSSEKIAQFLAKKDEAMKESDI